VLEDTPRHIGLLHAGDEPHLALTARTLEDIDAEESDWNQDVYSGTDDVFIRPRRHPTGQGAELIYLPGFGAQGSAQVAVEAVSSDAAATYRLRIFHGRLSFFERTGVIFPGEVHDVTTMTF
jgi:hypothetical protein